MADILLQTIRLAEALLFRGPGVVPATTLARALGPDVDISAVMQVVAERTSGLGFELVPVGDGWMFRTAADPGEALLTAT
ncbi:hypothetical protein AA23498_3447 [Acetobacter nitrogenifigens DSM 23921 = NBRC 105050]|uniref:SMC-Scp complex subunit ScpB n=1 Tax=Acetobacter nitrogenifigens DSM 23921 = NBRC 105050 TaxID=1120919 RepID=A0A511XF74_9PROT|nr:hypothetical protein [Acetobacter nitrogenifigens]GBQ99296.1 hypothetical protein AA23498_3447 [Acetobacter nitrogenifigens DSM 23921 = NBRC 105050]GEN61599.1 hypothetical protein ANI02nite_34830 [Acetobacter nitrogenifigens DSM 23921 = NBRC 105050]